MSAPTDFNDMINVHGKPRAFELIKQTIDAALQRIANGECTSPAPASEGVESAPPLDETPPEFDSPPPEAYADDPAAQKNARKAAQGSDAWRADLRRTDNGSIKPMVSNIELILTHDPAFKGALAYCELSYRLLKRRTILDVLQPGEWTDTDTAHVLNWLGKKYGFDPGDKKTVQALLVASHKHRFHPVRDHLRSLVWDGTPRLDNWLVDVFDARPRNPNQVDGYAYLRKVGRYFLIGAVARAMHSPVKMDTVLILEGRQGEGKSTAAAILFGDWFSDSPIPIGDKDGYQVIQGKWGVELGELDSFNKAESTSAKLFFSSKTDRYRPSYGMLAQDFPRQCVFIGTTNQDEYLRDYTGNRRYWPVYCMEVNKDALRAQRDQLWAEAMHYYMQGMGKPERGPDERWWATLDEQPLFEQEQDARLQVDPWQHLIEDWLHKNTFEHVTSAQVLIEAIGRDGGHITRADQGRLGPIMRALGWENKKKRIAIEGTSITAPRHVYVRPDNWGKEKGDDHAPF